MNVVTIKINGIEYNLKGEEREEYLHMVASHVDKKIKNIMSNNEKLSTSSAAILTALNLGDDMFKSHSLSKELSSKVESLEKHDRELTDILKENYDFYYFSENVDTNSGLSFDYKIKKGISKTRNAIKLLEYMGYPTEIISSSYKRAEIIEKLL